MYVYTKILKYRNESICTHLLTYAKFASLQKLESWFKPSANAILRICKSVDVNGKRKAFAYVSIYSVVLYNAPVICIPGPLGAGDTGDIAGLKCRNLTSDVSRQCRGCAGVLISR